MIIRSDEIEDLPTNDGRVMRLHIVRPAGTGRFPGVLFFSEIYQVTDPIRRLAAMVAGQGYLVAMPEVYHEYEPPGTVLRYDQAGTDRGNALKTTKTIAGFDADAKLGLVALARNATCNGRLATMGVCLGGHLAYRAALDPSVSAAACFYATDIHSRTLGAGKADDSLARMDELRAETLFVWGRQDPPSPDVRPSARVWRRSKPGMNGTKSMPPTRSFGTRGRVTIRRCFSRRSAGCSRYLPARFRAELASGWLGKL